MSERTGYAPWSLTREAGVQSATVDGTIKVPQNIQPDLIEGEFNYIGSFGPLDPKQIADILNPPS